MHKLFSFILAIGPLIGISQIIDSTTTGYVTINDENAVYFDTVFSIDDFLDFTDYSTDNFGIISLGNQGDVRRRLSYSNSCSATPNLGIDGYFKNYTSVYDIPFYNVKVPTGGIRFLTGYLKGQMFGAFFTVNPTARLNAYIDYQRINSRGNYFNQQSISDQLKISTSYSTKSNSYSIAASFSWNKGVNLEYGGIADLDDFESNRFSNRELIPINLSSSGNRVRRTEAFVGQEFNIWKFNSTSNFKGFFDFYYSDQYLAFQSSDSVFVQNALFESGSIRDSIRLGKVENVVGLALKGESFNAKGGITYSYYKFGNSYFNQSENLLGLKFQLDGKLGRFIYKGDWENYFNDSYAGSYQLNFKIYTPLNKGNTKFFAQLEHGLVNPGLFTQRYISNVFIWNNDLNKTLFTNISGGLAYKLFKITAGTSLVSNYVYFNTISSPQQYTSVISTNFVEAAANFKIVGGFKLDNRVRYQITTAPEVIRIPDWVLRHILYYEFQSFNNALAMHFGIEFRYFSSFVSENYMPATTVMYLQDDVSIGNFPYFNFFVDLKIREFGFFLRLENITQGLFEYNYYAAPGYPKRTSKS